MYYISCIIYITYMYMLYLSAYLSTIIYIYIIYNTYNSIYIYINASFVIGNIFPKIIIITTSIS